MGAEAADNQGSLLAVATPVVATNPSLCRQANNICVICEICG
jgi:hypothetical protein